MNIKKVHILSLALTSMVSLNAHAQPFSVQAIGMESATELSPQGLVLGSNYGYPENDPYLFELGKGTSRIGTFQFSPQGINASGDVIGSSTVYTNSDSYAHYVFYARKGHESVAIATINDSSYNGPRVAINDVGAIVVVKSDTATFYQGATKVSDISAAGILFDLETPVHMFANGDALLKVLQTGTPRWARVTSSGSISTISEDFLPIDSTVIRINANGSVVINPESLAVASLTAKPVTVALPSNLSGKRFGIVDMNARNEFIVHDDGGKKPQLEGYLYVKSGEKPVNLTCMFPNKSKAIVTGASAISDAGTILAAMTGKKSTALLVPTGSSRVQNFCTQTTVKIVGACKKYFDGLDLISKVPGNQSCTAEVTVKDAKGKPLSGLTVATSSQDTIKRGTTDASGKVTFAFKTEGSSSYMEVLAPYNNPKWLPHSESMDLYVDSY